MVILVVGPRKKLTIFWRSLTKYKKNKIVSFVNPVGPTFYYFISKHKTFYRCRSQTKWSQCPSLQAHTKPKSAGSHKARVCRLTQCPSLQAHTKPESTGSHRLSLQANKMPEYSGSHDAWVFRLTRCLSLQAY